MVSYIQHLFQIHREFPGPRNQWSLNGENNVICENSLIGNSRKQAVNSQWASAVPVVHPDLAKVREDHEIELSQRPAVTKKK